MNRIVRSLLLKILGPVGYLSLISQVYIRLIRAGWLKEKYPELHHIPQLIQPGWNCIDIGANVGYYSVFMSQAAGKNGNVYAVEPVPLFGHVFKKNTQRFALDNIHLLPFALGSENKRISMGTPSINGVFRHGLTHVLDEQDSTENIQTYEVDMRIPNELFAHIPNIHFIKCDVEGYEKYIFPELASRIERDKPLIQIEIGPEENRIQLAKMLQPMGYKIYKLLNNNLYELTYEEMLRYHTGDFYFRIG